MALDIRRTFDSHHIDEGKPQSNETYLSCSMQLQFANLRMQSPFARLVFGCFIGRFLNFASTCESLDKHQIKQVGCLILMVPYRYGILSRNTRFEDCRLQISDKVVCHFDQIIIRSIVLAVPDR